MSADNWGNCPRCIANEKKAILDMQANLKLTYGKVSIDKFHDLENKLSAAYNKYIPETLREDYEFFISESGEFSADYSACCEKCGFKFTFTHKEQVKVEKE